MILHTVNKSPWSHTCLKECLDLAASGSGILLLEDGVYGALDTEFNRKLLDSAPGDHKLYVLQPDLDARGISGGILPWYEKIGYEDFVELCTEYTKIHNWF